MPRDSYVTVARGGSKQQEPASVSKMDGSCLCGGVKYRCDAEPLLLCHCPARAAAILREMRLADRVFPRGHADAGVRQGRHAGEHLLAQPDDGSLVRDRTALDRDRPDERARGPQSAARGVSCRWPVSLNV